jgi:hypothetical protein
VLGAFCFAAGPPLLPAMMEPAGSSVLHSAWLLKLYCSRFPYLLSDTYDDKRSPLNLSKGASDLPMIQWILANQALFNVSVSAVTVIIWVIYAQLLYSGFRRQRTPRVIINRGKKKNLDALCIISNMSQEPVYVEYILITLRTSKGSATMDVTDSEQFPSDGREDENEQGQNASGLSVNLHDNTRQGPLLSGEFMHIGTFSGVVMRLARAAGIPMRGNRPEGDIHLECLTIQIIALYGPDSRPISASRSFNIMSEHGEDILTPSSWQTYQGVSFLHRRRLGKIVDEMNKTNFSISSTIRMDRD